MIINVLFTIIMLILAAIDIKTTRTPEHKDFKAIIMTTGVLGTFVGVFLGLLNFDMSNIEHSIPFLLDGLKIAFYTSIAGMSITIVISIYQRAIGLKIDRKDDLDYIALQAKKLDNLENIPYLAQSQNEMLAAFRAITQSLETNTAALREIQAKINNVLDAHTRELHALELISHHGENITAKIESAHENITNSLAKLFDDFALCVANNTAQILESNATINSILQNIDAHSNEINESLQSASNAINQNIESASNKINQSVESTSNTLDSSIKSMQNALCASFESQIKEAIFALNKEIASLSNDFSSDVICAVDNLSKEFVRTIELHFSENFKRFNKGVNAMIEAQNDHKKMIADSSKMLNSAAKSLQKIENIANSIISRDEKTIEIYNEVALVMLEYKKQNIALNEKLQSMQDLGQGALEALHFINTFFNDLNDYVKSTNENLIASTKKTIKNVFLSTIKEFEGANKKMIDDISARDNAMLKYIQSASKHIERVNSAMLDNNNVLFQSYQKLGKDLENNAKAISQNTSDMISNINKDGIKHLKNTTKLYFDDITNTQRKILGDMSNQISKNQEMLDSALLELIAKYIESLEQISISSIEAQKEIYLSNINNIKNLHDEIEGYMKDNALNFNQSNIELLNVLKILQNHVENVLSKTTSAQEATDESVRNITQSMREISDGFKGDYEWFLRRIRDIIGQRMQN